MIEQYPFKNFNVKVFQQPKEGVNCCGDSYYVNENDEFLICGLADGLGSGRFAKEASEKAIKILAANEAEPVQTIMAKANASQQTLRGIVMSLLKIDLSHRKVLFSGIGNINMIINNENEDLYAHLVPPKGYLSGAQTNYKVFELDLPKSGWFALYSDGMRIQHRQLPYLYRLLESRNREDIINSHPIRNFNDDATLIIGRFE